ncbi:MAG: DctP family TRAP transporter solute-binding subunit [Granulosicoccus sp.]|nr:DctP family TRAP transporter solute-binding subunit [Granulosicoccus sp.]
MLFRNKAVAMIGAVILSFTPLIVQAEKTMRIGHLNPEGATESHSGAMTTVFKSLVETATNGEIKVELFANGQLGKDNEVIQQVRDGIVESCISSSGGVAQHYPPIGIFDVPFAFPNINAAHDVIDVDSEFGSMLAEDIQAETGLKVLGMLDSGGFFAMTNSKKPIETVADMEGLRIRTMTLPTHEAIISSLGGQPTALPWAEVYTALQTGVADGQMNPVPIIAFAKFEEVQKYLSITNHIITPYVWFINQEFYDSLTDEEKSIVDWASRVAVDAGRGISRVQEATSLPVLAEKMDINAVPPAELAKFAAAAQPAVEALIEKEFGEKGVGMLEALTTSIADAQ